MSDTEPSVEDIRRGIASGEYVLSVTKFDEAWYAEVPAIRDLDRKRGIIRSWNVRVDATRTDSSGRTVLDGTVGEWSVNWHDLDTDKPAIRVEAFDDAWTALTAVEQFWPAMRAARAAGGTPEAVWTELAEIGFQDRTVRVSPYAEEA